MNDRAGYLGRMTQHGDAERRNANVTASLKFACGCCYVGLDPVPAYEVVQPGHVRPCSKHGPQIIVRVTTRLAGAP